MAGQWPCADLLSRVELNYMPNVMQVFYEDEGSYEIYQNNPKGTFEERRAMTDKLNQYYYDNIGPIPVVIFGICFAWNGDKILPFCHEASSKPLYLEYVRHNPSTNTFRLFNPWPGR